MCGYMTTIGAGGGGGGAWNFPSSKCANCGYCTCCGKSDIPGKLTMPEEDRALPGAGDGDS